MSEQAVPPLQLQAAHGEMVVWVVMPAGPRSTCVYRFDGSPLGGGFAEGSRERAIARVMLADAIEKLDRYEADRD